MDIDWNHPLQSCAARLLHTSVAVAAGTQKKMVLGKQKVVRKANKFLPQPSWGMGCAVSP